ncbi:CZB domain-containing protein [Arthrospira platensis]|jgi:hypothetical protein|uniref:Chemoreceptor zinc-binding domain-containing protein n=1 Tax=Limnospira platensis NIES-46 TaxID=1236695 RepID=A0A5M3TDC0_LIMPL|nr:CZB domain-containing protein [Arthrospira platensis]AMW27016.1 chemotaxis protein [Arthrospira platensis YZ]KDR54690.1 chemotaxis protein [Arthrospira platensis str. Paraca]MBD2671333.1 CZB domain-containing protein [Arthrospira platensis FACHB-439]MBD2712281.1 CZB domain-containing protein [Arthrospira platensis FACHB-835]MDF2211560.1 CZB domain-containing protein [Arthrospira platensis NCB002]MDT9184806.1 CZB domain-containing protein [Limnospira sp. PMC 289.06]MDT9296980.1 CZB domain-
MKFRRFLSDSEQTFPDVSLLSHNDCYLGKWLDGKGLSEYGNCPEIRSLEKVHRQLHQVAKNSITLKCLGKVESAYPEVHKIEPLSQQIITLLERLEKKVAALR